MPFYTVNKIQNLYTQFYLPCNDKLIIYAGSKYKADVFCGIEMITQGNIENAYRE
jgi:hypothetical protein